MTLPQASREHRIGFQKTGLSVIRRQSTIPLRSQASGLRPPPRHPPPQVSGLRSPLAPRLSTSPRLSFSPLLDSRLSTLDFPLQVSGLSPSPRLRFFPSPAPHFSSPLVPRLSTLVPYRRSSPPSCLPPPLPLRCKPLRWTILGVLAICPRSMAGEL
jgi:hypothetical protein